MTQQEARRIVEASTRFEVRGGSVWLREVRWLRAVERQRHEEVASPTAAGAESTPGPRWTPPTTGPHGRRSVPIT